MKFGFQFCTLYKNSPKDREIYKISLKLLNQVPKIFFSLNFPASRGSHFTGITLFLSKNCTFLCMHSCRRMQATNMILFISNKQFSKLAENAIVSVNLQYNPSNYSFLGKITTSLGNIY